MNQGDIFSHVQGWKLMRGDCIEMMRNLAPESVDLIVTDPAYESLEKHRAKGTTTRLKVSAASSNEWFPIFKNDRLEEFLRECKRALAKKAHLYIFCDDETSNVLWEINRNARLFKWWNRLVWDKVSIGMGYHWRARYEFVVFLEKGKRRLNHLGWPNVIEQKRVHDGYPTEKPVEVCQRLIENSSEPGDLVLDPFMGSGSTGVAAINTGRRFLGFDVQEKAIAVASKRLGFDPAAINVK